MHLNGWTKLIDHHPPAGWINNVLSHVDQDILRLPFDISRVSANASVGLKVIYLRTYINAGIFEIFLCGKKIHAVDALVATNHPRRKESVAVESSIIVNPADIANCLRAPVSDHAIEIKILRQDLSNPTRKDHKVKLYSIHLCNLI